MGLRKELLKLSLGANLGDGFSVHLVDHTVAACRSTARLSVLMQWWSKKVGKR